MKTRSWIYAVVIFMMASMTMVADEKKKEKSYNPLFPVALEHEFPDAEASFDAVRELILKHYYTPEIDETALYWAAIKGMLRYISPPESPELGKIWRPEDYDKVANDLKGVQVSIGIRSSFNASEGSLTVNDVETGSPADGLLVKYDRILRIDGEALAGKSVDSINDLLAGDEGSDVTLTVVRDIKVFDMTLKRTSFKTQNLFISDLNDTMVLIEVRKVFKGLSEELKGELAKLEERGIERVVLDLRHNTGGVFGEALKTAELFLPNKNILLRTLNRKNKLQNYISSNDKPFAADMVILVNDKTASSCEIIVGALQDSGKAVVVGQKTYGKGVFEKTFTLENDYRVKFIIGAMYTPRGKAWQAKGVLPDFAVKQSEKQYLALRKLDTKTRMRKDVPLITAVKLLRK